MSDGSDGGNGSDGGKLTDFDRLGGSAALREIIEDFLSRVFKDPMIGYLFDGKPQARVREMEYRHAAAHLGATTVYTGRSMTEAHRGLTLLVGHFDRRRQILANTLGDHGVDPEIIARWLARTESLRDAVMGTARSSQAPLKPKANLLESL